MIYRRLQERREYAAGGSVVTARTKITVAASGSNLVDTATSTDPTTGNTLASSVTSFNGSPLDALSMNGTSCNAWNEGLVYQVDTNTVQASMSVKTSYVGQTGCANNAQISSVETILNDSQEHSLVSYSFDSYNNVIDKKESDWGNGAPGALLRETQITYNSNGSYVNLDLVRLPTEVKVLNGSSVLASDTQYSHDEGGITNEPNIIGHDNTPAAQPGSRGNVTSLKKCLLVNGSCTWLTTTMTYDTAGNLISLTDPNSHTTTYNYNDSYSTGGSRNTYAFLTSTTDAVDHTMTYQYDYNSGQQVLATDQNGVNTTYEYESVLARPFRTTIGTGATTSYTYSGTTEVDTYQDQTSSGDKALRTRTLLDGLGRVSETDTFEGSSQYIASTQTYDALGRPATVSNPARPGETVQLTQYAYSGRTATVTMPDGTATTTTYSGSSRTVTDQAGHTRKYQNDAAGRLFLVTEDVNANAFPTNYRYDPLDNLTLVSQGACGNCVLRNFLYDSLSRLSSASNPESGTVTYTYDAAGNLLTRTDARNVITTYSYDAINRMTGTSYSAGSSNVVYSYDPNIAYGKGRLGSVRNGNSTTTYTSYDSIGQLLASTQSTSEQLYSSAYTYNLAGSLVSETYPSGRVVTTSYDGANRPSQLTGVQNSQTTNYVTGLSYASNGGPASYLYGNAVGRRYSYNNRLQPSSLTDATNNSNSNILFQLNLDWVGTTGANNGNLYGSTAIHGTPAAVLTFTQNFQYDALNRLSQATDNSWSRSFNYDQWGNLWVGANSGAPLAGNTPTSNNFTQNRLGGVSYDASGNQLLVNGKTIGYDAENHQVSATEPPSLGGATEYYYYDAAGQRVEKSGPAGSIIYVYDAFGQLLAEYGTAIPAASACQTCYLSTDQVGSLRLVTDQSGAVISRHDYLPYGEEVTVGRNGQWNANDNVSQKFTGQYRDTETGEDYFNARMFGSALGRFTSPDPGNAGADPYNPQSWNAYSYAGGNPMVNIDLSGQSFWSILGDIFSFGLSAVFGGSGGGDHGGGINPTQVIIGAIGTGINIGTHAGGSSGSSSGTASTPPSAPPVSSFPGGESLGLPSGMSLPGPFGISGTGCDFGPCSGGFNGLVKDPATLTAQQILERVLGNVLSGPAMAFEIILLNPSSAGGRSEIEFENANKRKYSVKSPTKLSPGWIKTRQVTDKVREECEEYAHARSDRNGNPRYRTKWVQDYSACLAAGGIEGMQF